MKIALQYANKRDGYTMALFSNPKRKFWFAVRDLFWMIKIFRKSKERNVP